MKIKLRAATISAIICLVQTFCGAQAPTQTQLDAIEKIIAPQRQKVLAVQLPGFACGPLAALYRAGQPAHQLHHGHRNFGQVKTISIIFKNT